MSYNQIHQQQQIRRREDNKLGEERTQKPSFRSNKLGEREDTLE